MDGFKVKVKFFAIEIRDECKVGVAGVVETLVDCFIGSGIIRIKKRRRKLQIMVQGHNTGKAVVCKEKTAKSCDSAVFCFVCYLNHLINHSVFFSFFGGHEIVAVNVFFNLGKRFAGAVGEQFIQPFAGF